MDCEELLVKRGTGGDKMTKMFFSALVVALVLGMASAQSTPPGY